MTCSWLTQKVAMLYTCRGPCSGPVPDFTSLLAVLIYHLPHSFMPACMSACCLIAASSCASSLDLDEAMKIMMLDVDALCKPGAPTPTALKASPSQDAQSAAIASHVVR